MPVIRATLSGPAFAPPTLDQVRVERWSRHRQVAHVLLAAESARRPGRRYVAPPCTVEAHAAIKATDATYAAATRNRRPWTSAGAELAECWACGSSLMRVAGKSYGGAS